MTPLDFDFAPAVSHATMTNRRFKAQAPVAQLDRALDYESRGQEFESLRARHDFNHLVNRARTKTKLVRGLVRGNFEKNSRDSRLRSPRLICSPLDKVIRKFVAGFRRIRRHFAKPVHQILATRPFRTLRKEFSRRLHSPNLLHYPARRGRVERRRYNQDLQDRHRAQALGGADSHLCGQDDDAEGVRGHVPLGSRKGLQSEHCRGPAE